MVRWVSRERGPQFSEGRSPPGRDLGAWASRVVKLVDLHSNAPHFINAPPTHEGKGGHA